MNYNGKKEHSKHKISKYLHDGEMLNSCSSSGWQFLNFLEEVETSGAFLDKNKTNG